jgi:collagenase-like PrtC family protease
VSYTQTDIDRLRSAIAKGASQVKMGEEQVTFRSLAEMRSLLAEMEAAVAGQTSSRQHYPQFMERP